MNSTCLFPCLRVTVAKSPITLVHIASRISAATAVAVLMALACVTVNVPAACAQSVAYSGSGAVNFGTANVCAYGKTSPAPCSQTMSLTYDVTASGALGTPQALTLGAPNLDFKLASGSTCTGSVIQGTTCKVNVTFAPIRPGSRNGAVEIVDDSGKVVATTFIYGNGVGPMLGVSVPVQSVYAGSQLSGQLAVDGSGNLFVVQESGIVQEVLAVNGVIPANPVVKLLKNFLSGPGLYTFVPAITVDGAGNVFVVESFYPQGSSIVELVAANGYAASSTNFGSNVFFAYLNGIAVDGSGDVFVSDTSIEMSDTFFQGGFYEMTAADYATAQTLGGGVQYNPYGIAVDADGDAYISQYNGVFEFTPQDGYTTPRAIRATMPTEGYVQSSLALDPAGNLFLAFRSTDSPPYGTFVSYVEELLAVGGVLPATPGSLALPAPDQPEQMAFDVRGNLYIGNSTSGPGVEELQLSTPAGFGFYPTVIGHTSADSPQSEQVYNRGNATLDVNSLSIASPDFNLVAGSGTPADCLGSSALISGAVCNLSISFNPTQAGPLSGAVGIVDNSLNAPGSQQSIPLSGSGFASLTAPHISSLNTNYGSAYSVVVLNGTNFGATQGTGTVTFSGVATTHYSWSDTQIYVTVPPNILSGNIVVTANKLVSNPVAFTVVPLAVVTGISPTSGPVGTVVTISGSNLDDLDHKAQVTFGGKSLPIPYESNSAIKVTVPAGAVTGVFHLVVNNTGIDTPTFTVTP